MIRDMSVPRTVMAVAVDVVDVVVAAEEMVVVVVVVATVVVDRITTSPTQIDGNEHSGIRIPDEVLAVPRKYQAMLYKGRDVMEVETGNVHHSRKKDPPHSSNDTPSASRVKILDDNIQNDDETNAASTRFGATGRNNKKSKISMIVSSDRRTGKAKIKVNHSSDYLLRARAEIDTRADTLCAGSTFTLYESTGKVVDVSGFHDTFDAIQNIQVGTCITAINLNGETIAIYGSIPLKEYKDISYK